MAAGSTADKKQNREMERMQVYEGRPQNTEGRMDREIRVYDFLDKLGVSYLRADHEAAYTMEACEEIEQSLAISVCKNLFLCNRQQTAFYMLMMPGRKKFKTKDLSEQIGSARLSFADEKHMIELLDVTPGSVSVMGLMNDRENRVRLLIDKDICSDPYFGCHPCINTSSLRVSMKDLTEKILPAMGHEPIYVTLPVYEEE